MDVAKINAVESELDSFVSRRDKERRRDQGERPHEAIWAESVRAHNAECQEAHWWRWRTYYIQQRRARRRTFALLDARDEAEIEKCNQMLGIAGPHGKDAA